MSRLIIIGAGGHGAVVAEAADATKKWNEIVFLDDGETVGTVVGFEVAGVVDDIDTFADQTSEFIVAIGNNRRRLELCDVISEKGLQLTIVVHPSACVSPSAKIAPGTVVFAGVVVNARAQLGRSSIINTCATVDHDCVIGECVHVSPGANLAGDVTVGECTWIGLGSAIKEGVQIGSDAIIGAGSAVISDVGNGETVGGVPARRLNAQ